LENERVQDGFELFLGIRFCEYQFAHFVSVERAFCIYEVNAKGRANLGYCSPAGPGKLMRYFIGINEARTMLQKQSSNGTFAATDATGESD
jgi:hypothetical protein